MNTKTLIKAMKERGMDTTALEALQPIKTYWSDDNGATVCADHAGAYLTAAIQNRPKAATHNTPLGTWERLSQDDVNYFTSEYGYCCETCKFSS